MALTADQAMEWLRANAIAPDPKADPRAARSEALDKHARMFASVFAGHDGRAVLQLILEASLFRPPVDHRLEGEAYLRFAQMREGQNQLAATILAYLDHAQDLKGRNDEQHRFPGGADPQSGGRAGEPERPEPDPEPDDLVAVR